jgi:NHL repeat
VEKIPKKAQIFNGFLLCSQNLFAFGDFDGKQYFAKLQHPLGVAYNPKENTVYVADTYNHKVKKIDSSTNIVTTCKFFGQNSVNQYQFNEPAGLCVSPNGDILFVADTNNHKIEMISLANTETKTLAINFNGVNIGVADAADSGDPKFSFEKLKLKPQGGKVKLTLILNFERGVKCTEAAPQKWQLQLPANGLWTASPGVSGAVPKNRHLDLDITVPSERENKANVESLIVTFKLNLCAGDMCYPKMFAVHFPIGYDHTTGQDCIVEDVNVYVNRQNVKI